MRVGCKPDVAFCAALSALGWRSIYDGPADANSYPALIR
jgi:hypothetical protein